ncbi:uncharacterized protein LOC121418143 [Lytechinus variegatus]|uniref:uncharacterized protein LOC121418143 n=1 Tax=Lytechinus variegatus TaxID=7654 RepID=UPI001BB20844|nr:uncharacterized protein LOC121418143 [Lytechinus variegatus]XP_041467789.1 uncharacterized protein LOC121418143 [Lytechinus variegatus]
MMSQANTLKPRSMLRKRLPRYKFESSDRTLLQNLVNKYIGILERKAINQNMLDEKKRAWQLITQKFNSQSVDKRIRDAKQLRKCWENMKWRARREVKQADIEVEGDMSRHNGHHLSDFTHPSHLTSGMMGVGEFMGGSVEQDDEGEEDDNEGEFDDDDDEEEMVAPMGTEPIEISDDLDHLDATETNGNLPLPLTTPHGDPRHPNGLPISHPPDDELIGSFVADAWIAEEAPGEDGDREDIHLQTEIGDASQENQIWNGSTSPAGGGMGGGASTSSSTRHTHTPPLAASDTSQDRIPRAPSVSSSMGDAAESLSSRHSISSSSRNNKRPRDKVYTNQSNAHQPRRPSSSASPVVLLDGDGESSAVAERSSVEEAERQMRTDEEHGKRMELLQAQLDFEKSKVERMRRMMEMSEIEHRARMRMLVRYQQVAEKQKEYWSHHVDTVKRDEVTDQF